jgi:hypothetical protein
MVPRIVSLTWLRALFGAACLVLLLVGCEGGGGNPGAQGGSGGGGSVQPSNPPLEGSWEVTLTSGATTTQAVTVPAANVPTSEAEVDTARIVRLLAAGRFAGYVTDISNNTLHVVDADTDYTMVINSVAVVNFSGCGNCTVGSVVSFDVTINFTESGTFDGAPIPTRTTSMTMQVRYRRIA